MCGCGAVRRVQDMLAFFEPVHFPNGDDLVLSVPAGHGIAEFCMNPEAFLIYRQDVVDQKLLPVLRFPLRLIVGRDCFAPAGFCIRQNHGYGRRLPAFSYLQNASPHIMSRKRETVTSPLSCKALNTFFMVEFSFKKVIPAGAIWHSLRSVRETYTFPQA